MIDQSWIDEFFEKKILIWGMGLEGRSSYRFIRRCCPSLHLFIADKNLDKIKDDFQNVTFLKEDEIQFYDFDMILKAPGIVCFDWHENITNQAELFLKHYRKQVIGITGTKGKSTTTSLIYNVVNTTYHTVLVGNIGIACFDAIEEIRDDTKIAFELSCHQLEHCHYSPAIAVFLNIYQEHLDHYQSYQDYKDAKANIMLHQEKGDTIIIHQMLEEYFDRIFDPIIIGKDIVCNDKTLITPKGTIEVVDTKLIGKHNYLNMAIAYYVGQLLNISDTSFLDAVGKFEPLAHRLQVVGTYHGVTYVDDSISTIGASTINAIESIPHAKTILIGGNERGIDYTDLENYMHQHSNHEYILMYKTGHRIYEEINERFGISQNMHLVDDLQSAVSLAKQLSQSGDVVILSPAASSYDHFKNFEERGEIFRKLVADEN